MKIEFFKQIEESKNVLIAGAGGGFDVFSGLPLYFWLRDQGKTVHLANLSFTDLEACQGERPVPSVLKVQPETSGPLNYFPELHLSRWLAENGMKTPIYAIERGGARPVMVAYDWLAETLQPDTLILVDGGTDSLMRGDEVDLGTPQEDMASLLAAAEASGIERKMLVCLGFGIDAFHGVCHVSVLESVAALIAQGGYLGAWSLIREMQEFELYRQASEYVFARMPRHPSIVNLSIMSAVDGRFGNHPSTARTEGSSLFINPLMAIYWSFRLEHVARQNLYLKEIRETVSYQQLSLAIEKFRARLPKIKPWTEIPC